MSRSFNGMGLLIAVSLAVACQAKPKEEPARGIPVELDPAELLSADTRPIELTSSNFKAFAWRAMNELRAQTEKNVAWGIDKSEWSVDQDTGMVTFTQADSIATAEVQIIGSYNAEEQTWLWSWANSSVNPRLQTAAIMAHERGKAAGIEKLSTGKWQGTEDDAWHMTAVAVKLAGLQGSYRGPAGGPLFIFMGFGPVKIERR